VRLDTLTADSPIRRPATRRGCGLSSAWLGATLWLAHALVPGTVRGADALGQDARELIRDPQFQRGFRLLDPKPGQRVVYGQRSVPGTTGEPAWDLAQWTSRFPLAAGAALDTQPGLAQWTNVAKAVRVGSGGSGCADLSLAVSASGEYAGRARKAGEPWVHLLVEQRFDQPPSIAAIGTARLRLEARLLKARLHRTPDHSPDLHAAQFQMFLTVQNQNRQSPGFGRLLWFGIPLYDDRARIPPEHQQRDTAGSDMFIFTPAGNVFSATSAHDRDWIAVDHDLRPLLQTALETAWARGFLLESREASDYRLTGMNLGWEVPGLFDVEMQVRHLSLQVALRQTAP